MHDWALELSFLLYCIVLYCDASLKGDMQRFFTKLMKSSF